MNLMRIGYFKEMPHARDTDPSINDFIVESGNNKEEIKMACEYLRKASVLVSCVGSTTDIINPEKGISGIPSCMTDGVWVWPGDYVYYVENYNVAIDEAFLEYMRLQQWDPSFDVTSLNFDELKFVDKNRNNLT